MFAGTSDRAGAGPRRWRRGSGVFPVAGAFACALAAGAAVCGADRALVPTDASLADRWLSRIAAALRDLEEGRHRAGVEVLQAALLEGGAPGPVPEELPPPAGMHRGSLLIPVDPGARAELASLKESILGPAAARSGERPAAGPGPPRILPRREARAAMGRRYLPLGTIARALLSALPPEAVRVYREVHDPLAEMVHAEWERAADARALHRLAREFFLTRRGREASEALGDSAFEAGEFREALAWWRSLLEEGPEPLVDTARVRAKALVALRLLGEKKWYELEKERLVRAGGAVPSWERDRPPLDAAAFAAGLEAAAPLVPREEYATAESPSRWGGELHFARAPDIVAPGEARPLPPPSPPLPPAGDERALEPMFRFSWDSWIWSQEGLDPPGGGAMRHFAFHDLTSSHHAFVPLVDGDDVYVSGVFSLYRFDGKDGRGSLVRKYEKPVPRQLLSYKEDSEAPLYTTTLWKRSREPDIRLAGVPDEVLITHFVSDRVRAGDFMGYDITVEIPIRSLVAFDARRGEKLWQSSDAARSAAVARGPAAENEAEEAGDGDFGDLEVGILEDEDSPDPRRIVVRRGGPLSVHAENPDKGFSYTSPALVKRGIVAAGGWIQRGYVRSVLRGLDLRSGRIRWETLLASAQLELTMFGEIAREPFAAAIAEADGILYYLTQMGAIAAVELESGAVRWITTYDTIEVIPTLHRSARKRSLSWGPNPLLLLGHILIATPRDSQYLYAIDTGAGPAGPVGAGRILWRAANPVRREEGDLRDFVGYQGGYLYFTGAEGVAALDVTGLDAEGRLPAGQIEPRRLRGPLAGALPEGVAGVGALTARGVIFADKDTLRITTLDLKRTRDLTERPFRRSEWGSYAGRVSVTPGRVVVASRQLLSAYVHEPPPAPPAARPPAVPPPGPGEEAKSRG